MMLIFNYRFIEAYKMSNTKLFYSYKDTKNTGKVTLSALSSYSDSIIFDEDNRRIWHNGKQYGNTYWGSKHGETFNDLDRNYAYSYAHAEGGNSYAGGEYSHAEGIGNSAYGKAAHVEGRSNSAYGYYSHAEGTSNYNYGIAAHTEGHYNVTYGDYSHVEGTSNYNYGTDAHIEGDSNIAYGYYSHAEGTNNSIYGTAAHVEGYHNVAYGYYSHAEGNSTIAKGSYSNSQGVSTTSYGYGSHAEGNLAYASSYYSHAEGEKTSTYSNSSHAEGLLTSTKAAYSHAEGNSSYAIGAYSHAEGYIARTYGNGSHAEGESTIAYGNSSHTEGWLTSSKAAYSHAEGKLSYSNGSYSHSEGLMTKTFGDGSHTEGKSTIAYGYYSHVEGNSSVSYGENSHAEGNSTISYGKDSHSEGLGSKAFGISSHAEGEYSYTIGKGSHAQGLGTVAYNNYEAAFGQYNKSINGGNNPTIYSIGDGTSSTQRHNIIDFRKNGDMHKNGSSYFHNNIYGPVSYTYVSSLGETATLDIVLSSLLTQPEYTRPKITAKYTLNNWSSYKSVTNNTDYTDTVELGTYFIPKFQVSWPTRTQSNTSGTRAYDAVCIPSKPNYLLGYSYGVVPKGYKYPDGGSAANNGISISYNAGGTNTSTNVGNKTLYAYTLDTTCYGATSPCYILGETTYTLFSNLQVTYLPFSKMYFQQLYDKGVYVHAMGLPPKEWLNGGVAKLGGFKVNGRLKYFCGFSGTEYKLGQNYPKTISSLRGGSYLGWLPISSDSSSSGVKEITIGPIGATNASKYCFWIAYPDSNDSSNSTNTIKSKHYKLVAQSSSFKIQVKPESALASDLIGDINKLKYAHLDNVTLAENGYKTRYKIAYIDFQKPLNIASHKIIFKIATSAYSAQELPESN